MTISYKTPTEIAEQYLLYVKGLKPEVDTKRTDSDWWVRSRVVGGVVAGVYADQRKMADDAFPQSARRDALEKHLNLYFDEGFKAASVAVGSVLVTGSIGTLVPAGQQFQYDPNGNVYAATDPVTLTAASGVVAVQSVATGQAQNILEGAELSIPSPPAGLDSTATVYDGNISDGRDVESNEEAAARILTQVRTPLAGGKTADYQQFALDADPSVTSANVLRFPFGFGTVGVVITAGTTDIDAALDAGQPIVLIPSDTLVDAVQEYIETQNPITDCATVLRPASVGVDVTVKVRYVSGTGSTVLDGQTLTQNQLVVREIKRAIYKTPAGGRQFSGVGYVVASELEEMIDFNLSAQAYTVGEKAQIIADRQVNDLAATGPNLKILGTQVAYPGTITVVEM